MKRIEPNLKDWAEALINGITGCDSYNPKLVAWVEAELNDIADKHYQMGDKDGWWKVQEERLVTKHTNALLEVVENLKKENLSQLGTQDIKTEGKLWRDHYE